MSNVTQLNLKSDRLLLDRATPWKTAAEVSRSAWSNRWCFKAGKWWVEIPDEGTAERGPNGRLEWKEIERDEVRQAIYQMLASADADEGNGIRVPFNPMKRDVDQVYDALKALMFDDDGLMDDVLPAESPRPTT